MTYRDKSCLLKSSSRGQQPAQQKREVMTDHEKILIAKLAKAYNQATATGTGRQAEIAERRLNAALDRVSTRKA